MCVSYFFTANLCFFPFVRLRSFCASLREKDEKYTTNTAETVHFPTSSFLFYKFEFNSADFLRPCPPNQQADAGESAGEEEEEMRTAMMPFLYRFYVVGGKPVCVYLEKVSCRNLRKKEISSRQLWKKTTVIYRMREACANGEMDTYLFATKTISPYKKCCLKFG